MSNADEQNAAEAEVAKLRFELERAVVDRDAAKASLASWYNEAELAHRELLQRAEAAEQRAERAEARVAELERELDAAQEHIHAGDECITSLHDDLARVADLVRKAHGHWDAIRWPEDKRYIAMLAEAIELLTVGGRDALPSRKGAARAGERCHCQWEAGDSPCPMHGDECAPRGHAPECERVTHPQSCHPCDCGAGEEES